MKNTGLTKQCNGEDWGFYKLLKMEGFGYKELDVIARDKVDRLTLQTAAERIK